MNIKTERTYQPHPAPAWLAVDDDSYDGPGSPIGEGLTEAEAIADLQTQVVERQDRFGIRYVGNRLPHPDGWYVYDHNANGLVHFTPFATEADAIAHAASFI